MKSNDRKSIQRWPYGESFNNRMKSESITKTTIAYFTGQAAYGRGVLKMVYLTFKQISKVEFLTVNYPPGCNKNDSTTAGFTGLPSDDTMVIWWFCRLIIIGQSRGMALMTLTRYLDPPLTKNLKPFQISIEKK